MKEKLYVVKIGGETIDDAAGLQLFLQQFAAIPQKKILIHGGGKIATKICNQLGIEQTMLAGRRVTGKATLEVLTMVYGGMINKNIVGSLQQAGINAIGLTGVDGLLVHADKRPVQQGVDYGYVGDIVSVNAGLLDNLLQQNMAVVLAPLSFSTKDGLLNTNADTIAATVAAAMSVTYDVTLVFGFDKNGVLEDIKEPGSVIPELNREQYQSLKAAQKIADGMLPKLENAFAASEKDVSKVILGNAQWLSELIHLKTGTLIHG